MQKCSISQDFREAIKGAWMRRWTTLLECAAAWSLALFFLETLRSGFWWCGLPQGGLGPPERGVVAPFLTRLLTRSFSKISSKKRNGQVELRRAVHFNCLSNALVWCWQRLESDWQSRREMIVLRGFFVEKLDDKLSRMTAKPWTNNVSSWCCTLQFKFPGMKQSWSGVVDRDDVDDFDELAQVLQYLVSQEGCKFIVAKVRVQIVISSEWSSAAVMFPNIATVWSSTRQQSWTLIQSRTWTKNSQSAWPEQMVISQDEICQWTPTLADVWKNQDRSLPSWKGARSSARDRDSVR